MRRKEETNKQQEKLKTPDLASSSPDKEATKLAPLQREIISTRHTS